MRKLLSIFFCLGLLLLLNMCAILKDWTFGGIFSRLVIHHDEYPKEAFRNISKKESSSGECNLSQSHDDHIVNDASLGGLLSDKFDATSCLSRFQSNLYRKTRGHQPSPQLISRLRNYEALHKQCGPNSYPYNKSMDILKSGGKNISSSYCKYVIWIPFEGMGNRMLTLVSAFLYTLLTNRILLIGDGVQMQDLFCEPFPEVSWLLPSDFPIGNQFNTFNQTSPYSYGNLLKSNPTGITMVPPFVYLHLAHDSDADDNLFFCDQDQTFLQTVPWLIVKSNQYFVPFLFFISSFQQELSNLFPQKETVFHHLGRYLFHPTNSVWRLITRYYEAYLAKADQRLGIQIRLFRDVGNAPRKHVLDQILACAVKENLLPEINKTETIKETSKPRITKAVLITSLRSGYYEKIRNLYWQFATVTGEVIAVHQPSHEEHQRSGNRMHDRKALAEMYLLSMTDKLVTSARSTFGYVAHSLGGLQPWILSRPHGGKVPDPPCQLASSMEPCMLFVPSYYSCRKDKGIKTANVVSHVRHCEDMNRGVKLFDRSN